MRKLLYIAYKFPPVSTGDGARNLVLARYMPAGGWEMLPLTASNPIGLPLDPTLLSHLPEQMKVRRTFHFDPLHALASLGRSGQEPSEPAAGNRRSIRNLLKRFVCDYLLLPDRAVTWGMTAIPAATAIARREKPELVMSFGPQHSTHLVALAAARLCGLPFVSHFGDLWMYDSLVDWGSRPKFTVRVNRWLERFVVIHSDGILTTTPLASDYFREVYGESSPPMIDIPNGYDPRRTGGARCSSDRADGLGRELCICYTGFFMHRQTPEPFLRGLRLFRDRNPGARIRFSVVGAFSDEHGRLPESLGVADMVDIVGVVPFSDVLSHQRSADVLMVCLPPLPGSEVKMPSKLAEYLLCDKPIMAVAPDGDLTRTVLELRAGYCCTPVPEDVCASLERIHADFTRGHFEFDVDPDEVARRFDMSLRCVELGRFLDGIANRQKKPRAKKPLKS
jgi:glycosyltransferase involved in cell wall biosynthesis